MKLTTSTPSVFFDESMRVDAPIEWWFVQGYFEGKQTGLRHFMASFFRHAVSRMKPGAENGFMLLLSVLEPVSGRSEVLSRVSPSLVDFNASIGAKLGKAGLEKVVLDAFLREMTDHGHPRPICKEDAKVTLTRCPLTISWLDFFLNQSPDGFELGFMQPGNHLESRFRFHPLHARIHIEEIRLAHRGGGRAMDLVSYPCMELTGRAGEECVRGVAWLDHQWGNVGSLTTNRNEGRLLGWDWFGINLENGDDFLFYIHRDMRSKRIVSRYGVYSTYGGEASLIRNFRVRPLRWWESGKTLIRYPVGWRIVVPELDADLFFDPLRDDQEIPVLGIIRAVWEGAGKVKGRLGGKSVAGRARSELHGYGYIFDWKGHCRRLVGRIDRHIEDYFPKAIRRRHVERFIGDSRWKNDAQAYTEVISKPIWDLMNRGGKHWRAIFGILLLEALGTPARLYEMLIAVCVELPHTGSLMIDDIEDRSAKRRSQACIHNRYGQDVAINAANALYFVPYLLVQSYPHLSQPQRHEIYQIMSNNYLRAHFGQGLDIYWSNRMNAKNLATWNNSIRTKILQSYALKTAAPVVGLAEIVCVIASADAGTRQACAAMAKLFGVAFQIIDDVLNFGDSGTPKGGSGEDLANGKMTYVIHRALERLTGDSQKRLQTILCSPTLRGETEVLEEGIELIRSSGALAQCRQEARDLLEEGWRILSGRVSASEPKTLLRVLCTGLVGMSGGQ